MIADNQPSDLRQYLNILAAQMKPGVETEADVILKTCQLIAMFASDKANTMPMDVFAFDLDDEVARAMLAGLCALTVRTVTAQQMAQRLAKSQESKIITPK